MKSTKITLNKEVTEATLQNFGQNISAALNNNEEIVLVVEEELEIDDNHLNLLLRTLHQCLQKNTSITVHGGGDTLPDIIKFLGFENTVTFG